MKAFFNRDIPFFLPYIKISSSRKGLEIEIVTE